VLDFLSFSWGANFTWWDGWVEKYRAAPAVQEVAGKKRHREENQPRREAAPGGPRSSILLPPGEQTRPESQKGFTGRRGKGGREEWGKEKSKLGGGERGR